MSEDNRNGNTGVSIMDSLIKQAEDELLTDTDQAAGHLCRAIDRVALLVAKVLEIRKRADGSLEDEPSDPILLRVLDAMNLAIEQLHMFEQFVKKAKGRDE